MQTYSTCRLLARCGVFRRATRSRLHLSLSYPRVIQSSAWMRPAMAATTAARGKCSYISAGLGRCIRAFRFSSQIPPNRMAASSAAVSRSPRSTLALAACSGVGDAGLASSTVCRPSTLFASESAMLISITSLCSACLSPRCTPSRWHPTSCLLLRVKRQHRWKHTYRFSNSLKSNSFSSRSVSGLPSAIFWLMTSTEPCHSRLRSLTPSTVPNWNRPLELSPARQLSSHW